MPGIKEDKQGFLTKTNLPAKNQKGEIQSKESIMNLVNRTFDEYDAKEGKKKVSESKTSGRKPKATGDCYEAAGKYMLSRPGSGLKLVHAEVQGQGSISGVTFGHAFVIDGDDVIDKSNGRNIKMPAMLYFAIGQIYDIGNYHEYSEDELMEHIQKYGHWGPWELQTESGL